MRKVIKKANGYIGRNYISFQLFDCGTMKLTFSDYLRELHTKSYITRDFGYILEKLVLVNESFEVEKVYVSDKIHEVNALTVSDGNIKFTFENDLECPGTYYVYEGRKILGFGELFDMMAFFVEILVEYFEYFGGAHCE